MDYRPVATDDANLLSEGLLDNGGVGGGGDYDVANSAMMQTVMMNSTALGGGAGAGSSMMMGAFPPRTPDNNHFTIEVNPDDAGPPILIQRGTGGGGGGGDGGFRGQAQQGTHFRDAPFAIGFLLHLAVIMFLAFSWGLGSLNSTADDTSSYDYTGDDKPAYIPSEDESERNGRRFSSHGLLYLCLLTSLAGLGISAASLELMTRHAEQLIQSSLIVSCILLGVMALSLMAQGSELLAFFWVFILTLTCLYAYSVWNRIPFAAANLTTGLTAVKANYGICLLGYVMCFVTYLWVLIWMLAFVGVSYKESGGCSTEDDQVCESQMNTPSLLFLMFSYFWTSQVVKNVLHVTIAGVVGTWWFAPQDANSMCSPAIQDSFRRATTYSFGSICMGSLMVAIVQLLQNMVNQARRQGGQSMVLCVLECLLYYIERVAKYFNKWALIYVGLYGYDYLTAGEKVLQLFQGRGWTTIINDNLVNRVLILICVVIGAITGLIGMLLFQLTSWGALILGYNGHFAAFMIGFTIGLSMSVVLMSVVLSAVDTVIVSFAEAPNEFHANHPALSQQMMAAWRQVYPQECGF